MSFCTGNRESALSTIKSPFANGCTGPKIQCPENLRPGADTYRAISTSVDVRPSDLWQCKTTTLLCRRSCKTVSMVSSRPTKSSTCPGSAAADSIACHLLDASGKGFTSKITSSAECNVKPASNPSGSVAWTSARAMLNAFLNDLLHAKAR